MSFYRRCTPGERFSGVPTGDTRPRRGRRQTARGCVTSGRTATTGRGPARPRGTAPPRGGTARTAAHSPTATHPASDSHHRRDVLPRERVRPHRHQPLLEQQRVRHRHPAREAVQFDPRASCSSTPAAAPRRTAAPCSSSPPWCCGRTPRASGSRAANSIASGSAASTHAARPGSDSSGVREAAACADRHRDHHQQHVPHRRAEPEARSTARNFPTTISVRSAGLMSSVSIVPRSFSPAVMSMAG